VVVLEGLTNHDNVGGIFRNAAAFGASAVLLDPTTCDPLYRKAIRVSVGGSLIVPYARAASSRAAIDALKAAGFTLVALSPSAEAVPMEELFGAEVPSRVAMMVGTEGPGLADATMQAADVICRIEMAPGFDSLNVSVATGIALNRVLVRQTRSARR
jgi:tRNA G18 (ribose-2'-O)-methylase SpoU